MAKSAKGAGNFLIPLVVVAVVVVGALAITFWSAEEEPPEQATIIPEERDVDREAGSGTLPEGAADENMEGISDQLDEVDPAAPADDTVPPAELATNGPDDQTEGETVADEEVVGTANQPVVEGVQEGDEGAALEGVESVPEGDGNVGEQPAGPGEGDGPGSDAARLVPAGEAGTEGIGDTAGDDSFLIDENSDAPEGAEVDTTGPQSAADEVPAGRDAQTNLTPEPGQDIVEDTDEGGTPFIPTPSGPEGREPLEN